MMPPALRQYLSRAGIQVDIMNTVSRASLIQTSFSFFLKALQRNACSTYNLLAEEGRRVAAALLPLTPQKWPNAPPS